MRSRCVLVSSVGRSLTVAALLPKRLRQRAFALSGVRQVWRQQATRFWIAWLAAALVCGAHEGGHKNLGPTKAAADLKVAAEALVAGKRKLAAQGRYECCVKPSCSLC